MLFFGDIVFRRELIKSDSRDKVHNDYISAKSKMSNIISARRDEVNDDYISAKSKNRRRYMENHPTATAEYIFPNQIEDANAIVTMFYKSQRRVASVPKLTKVGADGLMIEICKLFTTHIDDAFVKNPKNIRIITGMSNKAWETDMVDKAPNIFKKNIFHHGQLRHTDLADLKDGLIIIDEIDTGDKEFQVLHNTLEKAGILDIEHMKKNNNHLIFISATMIKELYHLKRWGKMHETYYMTIPSEYIGHKDFVEKKIIQEWFPLNSKENADKWINEDILLNYGNDYRVHIVRLNKKTSEYVNKSCVSKGIKFQNHTSSDRISKEELTEIFDNKTEHIVLGVKGFYRRANLIPDKWKLRIGATHEYYTKKCDTNVQVQGLPGRMTGYWRSVIENGHKTGPYRTSLKAVEEYINNYSDPFGLNSYHSDGFNKTKYGKVTAKNTILSHHNIKNLIPTEPPLIVNKKTDINTYRIYDTENIVRDACKILGYRYTSKEANNEGFIETSLNTLSAVVSLKNAIDHVPAAYGTNNGNITYRAYLPCYVDISDKSTVRFVLILRPGTDCKKIEECDSKYKSMPIENL